MEPKFYTEKDAKEYAAKKAERERCLKRENAKLDQKTDISFDHDLWTTTKKKCTLNGLNVLYNIYYYYQFIIWSN